MDKENLEALKKLIKNFENDFKNGFALDDPETDTERIYIEPFLELLGWNVRSREVKTSRLAGLSGKKTDYSFWHARTPLFILEAKAVSTSLDGYYLEDGKKITFPEKTIQYAWNTNVPVGVLFNFQELRIYNATAKVEYPKDALLVEPIKYTELLDRIEDVLLLSKDNVFRGILTTKVREQNIKQFLPLRQTIDKAILQQIVKWRKILLNHISEAYHHSPKALKNLRNIVHLFLDRIIFIRVVEDLNLEHMNGLWSIVTGTKKPYMEYLLELFEYMDRYYNSMLFHKSLLDNMEISDDVLSSIIKDTYLYRFDKLPIDLFGSFYENYIGHIINEENEIVKDKDFVKAKGIYYTAPQIVDLIISLTLRKKLSVVSKGNKKKTIPKITILDPACGSGSFIMRAFDEIVKYMDIEWELKKDFQGKKDILTSCIYGVDLDSQAVEAASTYLLIGLLKDSIEKPLFLPSSIKSNKIKSYDEDELHEELPLFHDTYVEKRKDKYKILHRMVEEGHFHLPTMMGDNATIRCGNSLISGPVNYLKKHFGGYLNEINPFDWLKEFPKHFKTDKEIAGFDIIIGNPPYRNMDEPKEGDDPNLFEKEKNYFQNFNKSRGTFMPWSEYYRRMPDIYYFFFYRGINLLKEGGLLGFITSRSYLEAYYSDLLRQNILDSCSVQTIIDFGHVRVFEGPSITTAITILKKCSDKTERTGNIIKVVKVKKEFEGFNFQDKMSLLVSHITKYIDNIEFSDQYIDVFKKAQSELSADPWYFANLSDHEIYTAIDRDHLKLKDLCEVGQGMQTAANSVFCQFSEEDVISKGFESSYIWKRATNSDIYPYYLKHGGKYAIYIEDIPASNDDLSRIPKNIKKWLIKNKQTLQERAAYQRGDCFWFRYTWPLHKELYYGPKIISPNRGGENRFYLDEDQGYLCFTDTTVIFLKSSKSQSYLNFVNDIDFYYILGLLNSRLLQFRYKGLGKLTGKGIREYYSKQIEKLPIKIPDKNNKKEKDLYKQIIKNSIKIQKLYKEAFSMPESFKRRKIKISQALDLIENINLAVEDLYGVHL